MARRFKEVIKPKLSEPWINHWIRVDQTSVGPEGGVLMLASDGSLG